MWWLDTYCICWFTDSKVSLCNVESKDEERRVNISFNYEYFDDQFYIRKEKSLYGRWIIEKFKLLNPRMLGKLEEPVYGVFNLSYRK